MGISSDAYLQLDDVVVVETNVPQRGPLKIYGLVQEVRARHDGPAFDSDIFLVSDGRLPAELSKAAKVVATRFEPEIYVPPEPGDVASRARGEDRDQAMYFDQMKKGKVAAGLSRDGEPVYLDLEFLDGSRGAHVNISGISGVATKTTYATFLLYSLFKSDVLKENRASTRALFFNVKGEDLLYLDKRNREIEGNAEALDDYRRVGLSPGAFSDSIGLWAPVQRQGAAQGAAIADCERKDGVRPYYWTVREFVKDGFLRFLFAEADDERSLLADLVGRVEHYLARDAQPDVHPACVMMDNDRITSFDDLVDAIRLRVEPPNGAWLGGSAAAAGTAGAFIRRLEAARLQLGHLIWGSNAEHPDQHRIDWQANQVSVIDIHTLSERAKRFVTGVVVKRMFEDKERAGRRYPLAFLVLDELNKYAPRDGSSPIKDVLLDIAERGRSLGVILIGAEQTASEVERRIIGNSAFRVVGRLDSAEAERAEYGYLPAVTRARAAILKPGSMILQQPHVPIPIQVRFPFPSWATRPEEAVTDSVDAEAILRRL
ncbi:MAG: ATP-binding protein [Dehalococcoidia bacterium]|nr:ATP-binding protein [Dehalococcoidia bacterium]